RRYLWSRGGQYGAEGAGEGRGVSGGWDRGEEHQLLHRRPIRRGFPAQRALHRDADRDADRSDHRRTSRIARCCRNGEAHRFVEARAMGLSVGIVGLPNVGKSTIFNALTAAGAQSANYPFCTIEPNVGIVPVVDARLQKVAGLAQSKQVVFTDLKVVDIAGLVRGASKGEGLGNQFLANIRETDAILHVVRCFEDTNVVHVEGSVDPERDIEVIETELLLADLDALSKRNDRVSRLARVGQKEYQAQADALAKAIDACDRGVPLRAAGLSDEET